MFLLSKFIILYKIMCFTQQIYRRQILIAKPRLYFFPDFTPYISLINNFMIFFSLTPKRVTTTSLDNRPKPAHPHRKTIQDMPTHQSTNS